MTDLANILQVTGGWGLSAVLCYVIYRLYNDNQKQAKKNHEEFVAVLKETTEMLASVQEHMKNCYIARREDDVHSNR